MTWYKSIKQVFSTFASKGFNAKSTFIGSLVLTCVGICFSIFSPFAFNAAIDAISSNESSKYIGLTLTPLEVVGCFCIVWAITKMMPKFRNIAINKLVIDSTHQLLFKLFETFMRLPFSYHLTVPMGRNTELLKLCYNNAEEFSYLLLSEIIPTLLEVIVAAGVLSYLYGFSMSFTLIGIVALYCIYNLVSVKWTGSARRECVSNMVKAQEKIVGVISNYETVHSFNNLGPELQSVEDELSELSKYANTSIKKQDLVSIGRSVLVSIVFSVIIFYIASKAIAGDMPRSAILFTVYYLTQFSIPLINFGEAINKSHGALLGLERVTRLIEEQEKTQANNKIKNKVNLKKNSTIYFRKVNFSYDLKKTVLTDISFKIESCQKVAIVGKSGSGKSTIVRLLMRYYDLTHSGSEGIYIDNYNISELDVSFLRSRISLVPQSPVLFNNTLRYNISYGSPNVDDLQIWEAIEEVGLGDYIRSAPKKLDTFVGERGLKISGGQLQRVAIARALLRKPLLFILDEATSGLDPKTEAIIQQNLDRITKSTNTLIVTHRLNTIKNADHILVLKEGTIIEEGNHVELFSRNGEYRNLWNSYGENALV